MPAPRRAGRSSGPTARPRPGWFQACAVVLSNPSPVAGDRRPRGPFLERLARPLQSAHGRPQAIEVGEIGRGSAGAQLRLQPFPDASALTLGVGVILCQAPNAIIVV